MRRFLLIISVLASPVLAPSPVFAHAFGQSYSLPIPTWIFLYGSAAVVIVSFLLVSYFINPTNSSFNSKLIDISNSGLIKSLTSLFVVNALKVLSLVVFLILIVSGLVGTQEVSQNIAPTFFWVIFLLGFTYFVAVFGNLWEIVNPWKIALDYVSALFKIRFTGVFSYPNKLSYYPAIFFYLILLWLELFSAGFGAIPQNLSALILIYSAVNFVAALLFGSEAWFKYGEVFSVLFNLVGKISFFVAKNRKIYLRVPFTGLINDSADSFILLIFILAVLGATAFDGFRSTAAWFTIVQFFIPYYSQLGEFGSNIFPFLAFLVVLGSFFLVYMILMAAMKVITKTKISLTELASKFAFSLLPIAVVYNIAHYYTLILTQGQLLISLISDPFGIGWNLFKTAKFTPNISIVRVDYTWYSQVFLIVLGHVAGVYIAHTIALKLFPKQKHAVFSQLPMLILMVLYTLTGLWILSQPFKS